MTDVAALAANLSRPRLLIRAARFGLADYNRTRDLRRLTRLHKTPASERAISLLLAEEERAEETRREGNASYSVARHIELLIALMAELRLLANGKARA